MMALSGTSRLLKALGDETRLRILHLLSRQELTGSDLMEILNMGQSRISTHLTLLKKVGAVQDRRAGRRSYFSLLGGSAGDLTQQVLEENGESPEFLADVEGLVILNRRHKEQSQSYFDRVAASFDEELLPGRTWEGLARAVLTLAPRGKYADLGIGDGLLTMMLAEVAESVTAVDLSPRMLEKLSQRARQKGFHNIETVEGDIDDLPLASDSYDVVVLSQALHHSIEPERALREAYRILAPGGRALVIDLLAHTEDWVRERLQHIHLGFTESRLETLCQAAGLQQVRVSRAARDPQPPHFMTLLATGVRPLGPTPPPA